MKWLKDYWPLILNCVVTAIALTVLFTRPVKTETVSTLDVREYGVAGGGTQRVLTFRGQGAIYEVVITEQ